MKSYAMCLALLLSSCWIVSGQSESSGLETGKTYYSLFIHHSRTYNEESIWTVSREFGVGLDIERRISDRFSLMLRTVWRPWDNDPLTIIQMDIVPKLNFPLSNKFYISPFIGAGPAGVIGNDYAGVFASWLAGVQLEYGLSGSKGLLFGAAFNNNSTFHPGSFNFYEIYFGFRF